MADEMQTPTTFTIATPGRLTFDDENDLMTYVLRFGQEQGMAITKGRTRKLNNALRSIDFKCDRGGSYRDRRTRVKLRSGWTLRAINNEHNHELDNDMSGHSSSRRLDAASRQTVAVMTAAGSQPRQIVTTLRQTNPAINLTSRTIYNERNRIRQAQLDGRTPISALMDELARTDEYVMDFRVGDDDNITHLFFAHHKSIKMVKLYGSVLLMDCTYKTNRFKMPLLEVVGITGSWKTFFCCFVFLAAETQHDYEWAMQAISTKLYDGLSPPITIATDRDPGLMGAIGRIFPTTNNIICLWHIDKNIVSNCRRDFNGDEEDWAGFLGMWKATVQSLEPAEFDNTWDRFETSYLTTNPSAVQYIKATWIPHKERFGTPWTRHFLHLKSTTTARVESAHHTIKSYIKVSTGHLRDVQAKICLAVENQDKEIHAKLMNDRIRIAHSHRIHMLRNIVGRVSAYALEATLKQVQRSAEANLSPCTNHFTTTMGLPCAHYILHGTQGTHDFRLALNDFNRHWWIDDSVYTPDIEAAEPEGGHPDIQPIVNHMLERYHQWTLPQQVQARHRLEEIAFGPAPVIHDPIIRRGRGRPVGSTARHNTASTQRDPSAFELAERTPRLCGRCRQTGHNVRNCPN
ncbi:hypothetical protein [Absidia glauca]|uniref:CCHC-type domain-containing protein n=1 Tax=Absidia glauca TaxID=4829 RepID=A0A163JKP3_ABSGL|nr:hypothetical protein [Absidia glauca]